MIVVRNTFQLKFGKAKDVQALWKEAREKKIMPDSGNVRGLVDVTGPAYTFVLESTHKDLGEWENSMSGGMSNPESREWYSRFMPLCEGSHRDIYKVVE
jgi:hypothetical protein